MEAKPSLEISARRGSVIAHIEGRFNIPKTASNPSILNLDSPLSSTDLSPFDHPRSLLLDKPKVWTSVAGARSHIRPKLAQGFRLFQELYPLRLTTRERQSRIPDSFRLTNRLVIAPKGALSEMGSPMRDFSLKSQQSSPNIQIKVPSYLHRKHSPTSPSHIHPYVYLSPNSDLPHAIPNSRISFKTFKVLKTSEILTKLPLRRKESAKKT